MMVSSVIDQNRTDLTYNFTVADFHTYYVTQRNVLVHNCGEKFQRNARKERNSLPETGELNSVVSNSHGTSMGKYGQDGEAVKDFNKGHGPNVRNPAERGDHVHDVLSKTHPK